MKHLYLLTLLLTFSGCQTVPELLDKGRYREAYKLAYKHCTRGRAQAPSAKHLDRFVAAYAAVQALEQDRARTLLQQPGTEKWASLYEIYDDLYGRSLDLLKVSSADARFDRYPDLAPARLEQQREGARLNAGDHYLTLVAELLPAVRGLEKPAAREAHKLHERIAYFLPERDPEFAPLRDSLVDIGTLRILLYAPEGEFAAELHRTLFGVKPIGQNWTEILCRQDGRRIDLEAELTFVDYSDSGPSESCSTTEYEEEVLDYIEKKKKEVRINDSTVVTKIVEVKHYKNVYASVTRCTQSRNVWAYGYLDVYLPGLTKPEWSKKLSTADQWSNSFSTGSGDHRALPAFANSGIRMGAPSLERMLVRAVRSLPLTAQHELKRRYSSGKRKQRWEAIN